MEFHRFEGESNIAYRQRMLVELAQLDKTNVSTALEAILRVTATVLGVERAEYWSFNDDSSAIVCEMLYITSKEKLDPSEHGIQLRREEYPDYFAALIQDRAIVAHDAAQHTATSAFTEGYLKPFGITSMLDTTVWFNKKLVGVLCLEHVGELRTWGSEEELFASFAAAMISLTLETADRKYREIVFRRQEEQYRYIFENSTDGIYRTDTKGRFVFANAAVHTLLGYDAEEILGKQYYEVLHPDQREEAVHIYRQQFKERIPSTYFEFLMKRRDGTEIWLGQNVQLVMEQDNVIGYQAVVRNITQRKIAESEILKALEKERQLSELKSRFVSMVLHELRTPLTGISLSTEMLQRYAGRIDEQQKNKSYQKIFANIKRIMGLMDGILLLSETEANKLTFKPSRINLEEFCRRVLGELSADSEINLLEQVQFSIQGCEDSKTTIVMADETLMRHIVGHLLLNAAKYSKEGATIRFDVCCESDETVITIQDSGIGIPADDVPFIFNTFHRAKNASEMIPGTGVGLSVVKQCVTMHEGTIDVQSTLGEGTTFIVKLPRMYEVQKSASRIASELPTFQVHL